MWFTRRGRPYETARFEERSPSKILNEDLKKGTACFTYEKRCGRCGGLGGGQQWAHTGWTCYECGGTGRGGVGTTPLYTVEKIAKLDAAEAKRNATRLAKQQAAELVRTEQAKVAFAEFSRAHETETADIRAHAELDPFVAEMKRKLDEGRALSEKQLEVAARAIDRIKARAVSRFVGAVGERADFVLTIERKIQLESFGPSWQRRQAPVIYLMKDATGNKVVYKGTSFLGAEGATIQVKATVEDHETFRGEEQTRVARPKLAETAASAC